MDSNYNLSETYKKSIVSDTLYAVLFFVFVAELPHPKIRYYSYL